MKLKIFAIYDSKAQAYIPPFFVPHTDVAKRTFGNAANDKGHAFGANPADYTLFELGEWDDNTTKFSMKATPRNLGVGIEFLRTNENERSQEELFPLHAAIERDIKTHVGKTNSQDET